MNKPLVLATAIATLLVTESSRGADLYWDGTTNNWNDPTGWSTTVGATTPNPAAVPGPSDRAIFSAVDISGNRTITLSSDQTVLGLATTTANKGVMTLVGDESNRVLSIGTEGINHTAGGLDLGSSSQPLDIRLLGTQTWNSSSSNTTAARAIFAYHGISLGLSGNHTLTFTGTTTGSILSGEISDGEGVLGITKDGSGRWTLNGENSYTGPTTISSGSLAVSSITHGGFASGLGASSADASNLVFDGGTLVYSGSDSTSNRGFTITNGKTATFEISTVGAVLTLSGNSVSTTGGLTKTGQGGLELQGVHTFSGQTSINQGRLLLTSDGSIANSAVRIGQLNSATIMNPSGGTAILTVAGNGGAVARAGDITVDGGVMSNLIGARTLLVYGTLLADSHDSFGNLTVNNGSFWGNIVGDGGRNARVTFAGMTRAAGTQLHFGDGTMPIGTTSIASASPGTVNIDFTSQPTSLLVGGGALGTRTAGVLPFVTVNGLPATYDPTNGLRALDTANEMSELASATAGQNAKLTNSGLTTLSSSKTVNSLWGAQGRVTLGTNTLSITSGAIAATGSYTIGTSASDGTIDFGTAEGNIMVGDGAVLTINSVIAGSGGLTIGMTSSTNEAATLVLGGANTFTGTTTITGNNSTMGITLTNSLALQNSVVNFRNYGAGIRFGADDLANGVVADLTSATFGGLQGPQSLVLTNRGPSGGGVALTVGSATSTGDATYTGTLSGLGSLIKDGPNKLTIQGGAHNTYSGSTTVKQGILAIGKSSGTTNFNAIPGDLNITTGGKLQFLTDHQIADSANVVMSGAGSVFNGTGTNVSGRALTETFSSLTVTGGSFNTGASSSGITVTGMASFTGGEGGTIFLGNSGFRFTVGGLSITNMTESPGSTVDSPNTFSAYGNAAARSRLTVGSLGLTLNGSVLNMRRGNAGSQLIINGDVTTTGSSPSRISLETSSGSNGTVSLDLSSTTGAADRTFNIGGGGADFSIDIPIVNGTASSGAITKTGPGTMSLLGASTYTGGTTINEGTLLANNSGSTSATGTGPVSVQAGGTLGGTGRVNGAVTVAAGGTLMGGTEGAVGQALSLAGNVSLAGDSEIKLTLGPSGTHSTLMRISGTWTFALEQAFTFIELGGGVGGFYDNIITGLASAPAGISQWTITNSGFEGVFTFDGANVDLNLTSVPEPTSALLLLTSATLLGGFRRFRRGAA